MGATNLYSGISLNLTPFYDLRSITGQISSESMARVPNHVHEWKLRRRKKTEQSSGRQEPL